MIRKCLTSVSTTKKSKLNLSIVANFLVLLIAVWLVGCAENPIADEAADNGDASMKSPPEDLFDTVLSDDQPNGDDGIPDTGNVTGKIVVHQTGGFAGFSRIITIEEKDGAVLLVYADQNTSERKESRVSSEDLEQL